MTHKSVAYTFSTRKMSVLLKNIKVAWLRGAWLVPNIMYVLPAGWREELAHNGAGLINLLFCSQRTATWMPCIIVALLPNCTAAMSPKCLDILFLLCNMSC